MKILTEEDKELFVECVRELESNTFFEQLKAYRHHFHTSTYYHSISVAYMSFWFSKLLRLDSDMKELIYAALLHDYYLYDCHDGKKRKHLVSHPKESLKNARRDWSINLIQENIISRHMFPFTLTPPKYKESVIVTVSDKLCALYEVIMPRPYKQTIMRLVSEQ